MSKNDLWIASLAALLSLKLVTTDADFDHSDKVSFEIEKISPEKLSTFFNSSKFLIILFFIEDV